MHPRTKHFFIWAAVGVTALAAAGLLLMKLDDFKRGEDILSLEGVLNKVKHRNNSVSLKTYQGREFSFKYLEKLTLTEANGKVDLHHEIPYKNHGDCDMKGDDKIYNTLTDFGANFQVIDGTVRQAVKKLSPYMPAENFTGDTLKISPGFIDAYQTGNLTGFAIYEGAERSEERR